MDRNTLTGLALMAVILFGFMYLNKPDATQDMQADQAAMEQLADNARHNDPATTGADSVTAADMAALRAAVRATGTTTLHTSTLDIAMDSTGTLAGTIEAGKPTGTVALAELSALAPADRATALAATLAARTSSASWRTTSCASPSTPAAVASARWNSRTTRPR